MKGVKPLILAGIVAASAAVHANDLDKVIDKSSEINKSAAQSQTKIDKIADSMQGGHSGGFQFWHFLDLLSATICSAPTSSGVISPHTLRGDSDSVSRYSITHQIEEGCPGLFGHTL